MNKKRTISGAILLAVVAIILILGNITAVNIAISIVAIIAINEYFNVFKEKNNLDFIKCACKITQRQENSEQNGPSSKREEIKELIQYLKTKNKNADINIFNSTKNINLDTIISYKKDGKIVNFLDEY